ncbi:hypothetical protein WJX81_002329 [Elliptochloris bilobata]|uniref:Endoglucanase n=1 Tax=Elliptochloris bilobata TaxID=381761 RepID=A0AAW1R332_9CHLO
MADEYKYGEVLGLSLLFYEAQRSGKLPADNRVAWRGDSALRDASSTGADLSGGWYDAGDNLKLNFPAAWAATVLAWGHLEFPDGYASANQTIPALRNLKWIADYLAKCHYSRAAYAVIIGDAQTDHENWARPEEMTYERPVLSLDANHSGSDALGQAAAALASISLVFKGIDAGYSAALLANATDLFKMGTSNIGRYSDNFASAASTYPSTSMYDDLAWGAAWLYRATNDTTFLSEAQVYRQATVDQEGSTHSPLFSWDNTYPGVEALLAQLDASNSGHASAVEGILGSWVTGDGQVQYSPAGLAWGQDWGSLRMTANAAFLALVYAKQIAPTNPGVAAKYSCWARSQVRYMLGDAGRSYVVGYGKDPPQRAHHRGASCRPGNCSGAQLSSPDPNPNVLTGALVGGPRQDDSYNDTRGDYSHNEPAVDYNAGFSGALAALVVSNDTWAACKARGDVDHIPIPPVATATAAAAGALQLGGGAGSDVAVTVTAAAGDAPPGPAVTLVEVTNGTVVASAPLLPGVGGVANATFKPADYSPPLASGNYTLRAVFDPPDGSHFLPSNSSDFNVTVVAAGDAGLNAYGVCDFRCYNRLDESTLPPEELCTLPAAKQFVQTDGTRFKLDGKPWYFSGTNQYSLVNMHWWNDTQVVFNLAEHARRGVQVMRVFFFFNGNGTGYEASKNDQPMQPSVGVFNEVAMQRADLLLAEAGKKGIRLILALSNWWDEQGGVQWYVDQVLGDAKPKLDKELFFTDPAVRTAFKKYVYTILHRNNTLVPGGLLYKDDPTVLAWELQNEPQLREGYELRLGAPRAGKFMNAWVAEMSSYIKALDGNHLVAIGDEGWRCDSGHGAPHEWMNNGTKGIDMASNIALPGVDFATVHLYPGNWLLRPNEYHWLIPNFLADRAGIALKAGKPIILEEFGNAFGYVPSRDAILGTYLSAAHAFGYSGTLVWQVFPWPTDNLTGAGFDFFYESPGGATMLATYAATHARNRLLAELQSNGGLL